MGIYGTVLLCNTESRGGRDNKRWGDVLGWSDGFHESLGKILAQYHSTEASCKKPSTKHGINRENNRSCERNKGLKVVVCYANSYISIEAACCSFQFSHSPPT
ncbi:GQ67_00381T0 [Komagataella phaffii]|nr:GQ67_00381T0 [Komagataella phaffii]CAH2448523.1 Predicted protein [Komagataella phaffii CBS 7435]